MKYIYIISILIMLLSMIVILLSIIKDRLKFIKLKKNKNDNYAILIPARDESKVIEKLLKSIQIQNKNMNNVYVIVEDESDPTCKIVDKYNANIFIREKPIRPRKGYALDECLKYILKEKHYDLYFIFDADNILDEHFIKNMLESWHQGYEVAVGYRNILNPVNKISCCSGILFFILNSIVNQMKIKNKRPIIVSGTGFYISGKIIEKLNGFPFNSLTEDYELSLYLASKNIPCMYNKKAIYYDEQPTLMKVSLKQRTRWMKGYFEARKNYVKNIKNNMSEKVGIYPYVSFIIGYLFLMISNLLYSLIFKSSINFVIFLIMLSILYVAMFLITLYLFITEKNLNIDKKLKIKCLFYNPIFLTTYSFCFFKGLLSKDITWHKIEHVSNFENN